MQPGCYTALITPFNPAGELDQEGLEQLIDFQIENDITGILATGTTGESPTFKWKEHDHVIAQVAKLAKDKCIRIAGTGSNNTIEALEAAGRAAKEGVDAVLMVDPYYNGPSSLEIRREYYEVIAKAYPDVAIIPYIIPGRTGSQMLPQDLAILAKNFSNISCVKEATGNLENMKLEEFDYYMKHSLYSFIQTNTNMTMYRILACQYLLQKFEGDKLVLDMEEQSVKIMDHLYEKESQKK